MYGALWRVIPGPWWVKSLVLAVAAAAVLYGLFFYAFPWLSAITTPQDPNVG